MTDVIIMIALWCGQPAAYRLDVSDVQACRNHMLTCIKKSDMTLPDHQTVLLCAEKEKLK